VLLELGDVGREYLSELSYRQRSRMGDEVLEVWAERGRRCYVSARVAVDPAEDDYRYGERRPQ
jgi:hypothetical protein